MSSHAQFRAVWAVLRASRAGSVSARDLVQACGCHERVARRTLAELAAAGVLVELAPARGSLPAHWSLGRSAEQAAAEEAVP